MGENTGDIELTNMKSDPSEKSKLRRKRRRRRCLACCGACTVLLLLILVVLVILAFTLFKPKRPKIHVDSIMLEDFDGHIALNFPPSVKLNVTLGLVVSVTNPNKIGFKFYNSTSYMFYRDKEVGFVPIPAGKLGAGKTIQISSSLKLLADRLLGDVRVYTDFFTGSLPFSTRTDISGRVNIAGIIKRHVDTSTECDVNISVSNVSKGFDNPACRYDVDL